MRGTRFFGTIALVSLFGFAIASGAWAQYASTLIAWDRGGNTDDYDDPNAVLGSPDRMTAGYPSGTDPVTIFNPAWGADTNDWGSDQVFSFGAGGYIEVMFDAPVEDDPLNPFGIDLIVFGNAGFLSADWPPTACTDPALLFGADYGTVEVSQDGASWHTVTPPYADVLFPTTGWADAAHTVASDFLRPVDPGLTLADLDGRTESEVLALYGGSGGGTGIDIAGTGLAWIRYVRVTNTGHPDTSDGIVDIDAFADVAPVPEPGLGFLVVAGLALGMRLRKK
jgi:hypothetical protein